MRKILTIAILFAAPLALAACGQKAEEAAPVEEVATETPTEPAAADPAATDDKADDAAAAPADEAKAGEAAPMAEPDPKNGPPER